MYRSVSTNLVVDESKNAGGGIILRNRLILGYLLMFSSNTRIFLFSDIQG